MPDHTPQSIAHTRKSTLIGMALALLACVLWSFNFIIARGISQEIPPATISFYRWLCATVIIVPIAWKKLTAQKSLVASNWKNILWATLTGIALYSPLIYLAGHYSPAINLALIGTTTVPIFTYAIAAVFLKEKITVLHSIGLLVCLAGIVLLISKGSWYTIIHFHFSEGDKWMLLAALLFSLYNIIVRKKSLALHPLTYLASAFILGTLLLLPLYLWELNHSTPVHWNTNKLLIILYSGAGTSVAAFFCWNAAIARIGSGRTAIFGNSIPVLATIEAILILGEKMTWIQGISMLAVATGLVLSNLKRQP
jgi:drug/metabolite transporter (DMT)-like permease